MQNRAFVNTAFVAVAIVMTAICALLLLALLGTIILKGAGALSLQFLTSPARDFGAGGGIFYQIIGSLLLVIAAAAFVLPIALGTALFKSEFLKSDRLNRFGDIVIYSLNGIPSVIFGVFGLIVFVNILGLGISWFAGALVLALMMLPTVVMATYQSLNAVPQSYRENASALGLTQQQVILRVLLPQGMRGAVTGLLIALARAIGETAPIMFVATAFTGITVPQALRDPVVTLPTHILALAQQATNPAALQNAWGASLVLLVIVLIFSFSAMFSRLKLTRME